MTSSFSIPIARVVVIGLAFGATTARAGNPAPLSLEQSVPMIETRTVAAAPERQPLSHGGAMASLQGETTTSVRERAYTNGLRQDILLKGSPVRGITNSITVLARTSRQPTFDEQVPLYKPTEGAIRSEIGAQFPHIAMQIAERESSNAYGPYGLALGRAGGDVHCAYMWQWIDENRLPAEAGVTGPASIRIRLCQTGTTFDAMAAELDHLTIGVAAPSAQVAAVEAEGIILAPPEAGEASAPISLHPKRRVAHDQPRAHKTREHRLARRVAPVAEPTGTDTSPRYMTAAAASAPVAPQPPAAATTRLSGDLPAQAYLGPGAAQKTATTPKYY